MSTATEATAGHLPSVWHAMTAAAVAIWKAEEDDRRAKENPEQTTALRRYLVRRILDGLGPVLSYRELCAAVDPDGNWWTQEGRPGTATGQPLSVGAALFWLALAESEAGRPLLNAMIARKRGNRIIPGRHFANVATVWCDFEVPAGTEEAFHRNELLRCERYWRNAAGQV